ncbi:MAG TPA: Stp1/IreP family PP2C-type Ser/Thr phosphatase [bacterium]|nr:Stp1/IreP family PP2C-type Ser/Thr phosphatase [bacterium]
MTGSLSPRFECAALTDRGLKRSRNEDAFVCDAHHGIFLVADGMGGEQAGDTASRITADVFARSVVPYLTDEDLTLPVETSREHDPWREILCLAVKETNRQVVEYAERQGTRGMGSTLTAAVVIQDRLYITHVGDSRLYLTDGRECRQITRDHTKVEEMVARGVLTPEQARNHPQKNIITRCVGRKKTTADIEVLEPVENAVYLICSDGLVDMVPDSKIYELISGGAGLEEAAKMLVEAANDQGGRDNITVVLFRI